MSSQRPPKPPAVPMPGSSTSPTGVAALAPFGSARRTTVRAVVQVVQDELAADGGGVRERVRGFGDDFVQRGVAFGRFVRQVDRDDPVARGVLVRLEQEDRPHVHDVAVESVPLVEEWTDRGVRFVDPPVVDRVFQVALLQVDQQVLAVLGDRGVRVASRVLGLAEHQPVFALVGAEGMEVARRRPGRRRPWSGRLRAGDSGCRRTRSCPASTRSR